MTLESAVLSHGTPTISFNFFVTLRWVVLGAQSLALLIVHQIFKFSYEGKLSWSLVGLSTLINLLLMLGQKKHYKIPFAHLAFYLLYDIGQLTVLLYVTGGLNNPFALFLLAPIVISAGFLPKKESIIVTGWGMVGAIVLFFSPFPLPWMDKGLFLPDLWRFASLIGILIGMAFIWFYVGRVTLDHRKTVHALQATELALAQAEKRTSLGGLAAATAHELGSPLTTIMITVKDLQKDLRSSSPYHQNLKILLEQTQRCRDILQKLSQTCAQNTALSCLPLPLGAAIKAVLSSLENAPTKKIEVTPLCERKLFEWEQDVRAQALPEIGVLSKTPQLLTPCEQKRFLKNKAHSVDTEPVIFLTPDLEYAFGNLIMNGLQFAHSQVTISYGWTQDTIVIHIKDDGPGYSQDVLYRLGDPYVSSRHHKTDAVHLGLGIFTAQTLLAPKGGIAYFKNDNGAVCTLVFPRQKLDLRYTHAA